MTLYRQITIACALLFACNLSFAEDWYQIEVIAFEYKHPNEDEMELWDKHPGEPDWKAGINLMDEATAKARRKQQTAAEAAPAPAAAPKPTPEPVKTQANDDDSDDDIIPVVAHAPLPVAEPIPAAPANTDVSQEKFVTVEDILSGHSEASNAPSAAKPASGQEPLAFVSLPSSQFSLGGMTSKLDNKARYRILSHRAWRQPAFTGNTPQAVHIAGGNLLDHEGANGARYEFEALISLRTSRYLHLDVDAILREPGSSNLGGKFDTPADLGLLESTNQGKDLMPVYDTYRLMQSQRVRSNKVYYYDHPLMGLIVKISPYGG